MPVQNFTSKLRALIESGLSEKNPIDQLFGFHKEPYSELFLK